MKQGTIVFELEKFAGLLLSVLEDSFTMATRTLASTGNHRFYLLWSFKYVVSLT